ncbi:glycosyltransferase [Chryseomicrobium aureum]|uniref:bifunctional glycosyltransferase family 2/GtrA family protein n=1 Tax=Chryseomicrobium aureum TaxID=1441723 RepID=UPI00195CEDD8|nr:bifunctional glycosyltransferase family 2/GtrA family protein [Chryseomicrobium aureum]MBM7706309.1 glycosyltransferase involved in cell wall biosynthesis [Chryseomicrobium aureum]
MELAIVIPSYKPDDKCRAVIDELIASQFSRIIVVDDGGEEEYASFFTKLKTFKEVTVLHHAKNQGKGRALKTAFHYILNEDIPVDGVITIDADGQHLLSDMQKVAEQMRETPDAVILGARDFTQKDVPFRSRFGNRFTRLLFRLSTGTVLTDTQTGLRGLPIQHLPLMLEIKGERFEYEMNVLGSLKRNEIPIEEVEIETVYLDENKSSHFHPLRDSFHIYKIFLFYGMSGGASLALDLGLYSLFIYLWKEDSPQMFIIFATIAARVLSSLFNYFVNRHKVFGQGSSKSFVRYYLLAAFIMAASAGSVHLLYTEWLGRGEVVLKVLVDSVLFIFGFIVQRAWVFRKEN